MDSVTGTTDVNRLASPNEAWFYPNPASSQLYFKNTNGTKSLITIFNMEGQQVLHKQIETDLLDISKLKNGIYTVKLVNAGNIQIKKLVKQ
jgi:hypothetical protein